MIGLVDFGAGNMRSVANAFAHLGFDYRLCVESADLRSVDRLVLPGVGHFGAACKRLTETGILDELRFQVQQGKPYLGICLGLQLLFDSSDEAPAVRGLGLLPGHVTRIRARCVPHMGWNRVEAAPGNTLFEGLTSEHYYFAHSYVAAPEQDEDIIGTVTVEDQRLVVAVGRDQFWGVQFHPEKSGEAGLALLKRFAQC